MDEYLTRTERNHMKHEQFAQNLKRLLKESKMSQLNLSYATGVNTTQITTWAAGRNLPSLESLAKVRAVLGCTWDELLGENGEMVLDEQNTQMMAMEYRR